MVTLQGCRCCGARTPWQAYAAAAQGWKTLQLAAESDHTAVLLLLLGA
jgi:hypothetical protein